MSTKTEHAYWQVAAGSGGRNYERAFLKYGMAFVGGDVHRATMARVKAGDVMVLKRGRSSIVAAGRVVERDGTVGGDGDKAWLRDFDGWDLPAYCYVCWHVPDEPVEVEGLTRTTIEHTRVFEHHALADRLIKDAPPREPDPEPQPTRQVNDDEILKFLVARGLRPGSADELTETLRRIRVLASYYYEECSWSQVREHETRTFLVIPLLLALGWSEQRIKIEYPVNGGRVDIVCLAEAQHQDGSDPKLVIETKDFSRGLDHAQRQVRTYGSRFPTCRALVVTNGYCYKAFLREPSGAFSDGPDAYLNVVRPTERYPLRPESVGGALDLLDILFPAT